MRIMIAALAGSLLVAGVTTGQRQRRSRGAGTWTFLAKKYDKNQDGKITWAEYARNKDKFQELDTDGDGAISQADFSGRRNMRRRRTRAEAPKKGQVAPDFDLPLVKDSKKTIKLSSFRHKKPVALIFGSYT